MITKIIKNIDYFSADKDSTTVVLDWADYFTEANRQLCVTVVPLSNDLAESYNQDLKDLLYSLASS